MAEYTDDVKRLVKERLAAMPPGISFSIGNYGDFSPGDLIKQVDRNTEIGKDIIEMQLGFIRKMPKLSQM